MNNIDLDFNVKRCVICLRNNNCLHWHRNPDNNKIWVYCVGKCKRGYSIEQYCYLTGLDQHTLENGNIEFEEAVPNEVRKMEWPSWYVPLSDTRAKVGEDYVKSRGLTLEGDMYFDYDDQGIVFPYYFQNIFVGAQTRFVEPKLIDGEYRKIDTVPGTRLGLLFYNWNQAPFVTNIKGIIVCEGAFNALSIQQSLNLAYGGVVNNPWKAVACSGANSTNHQIEAIGELKAAGMKIILAPDTDEAGLHMLARFSQAGVATHRALADEGTDWNDKLKSTSHKEFAPWFLGRVTSLSKKK